MSWHVVVGTTSTSSDSFRLSFFGRSLIRKKRGNFGRRGSRSLPFRFSPRPIFPSSLPWRHRGKGAFDFAKDKLGGFYAEAQVFLPFLGGGSPRLAPGAAAGDPMDRARITKKVSGMDRPYILELIFGKRWHFLI